MDQPATPDNTAVRVALWRALHILEDAPPHVLDDTIGLALVDPPADWRARPDMGPFTRPFRASIVARARFVEDHVTARLAQGVSQLVILGAGLDTTAQRRPDLAARLRIFEVDAPETQSWKQQRLAALGLPAGATFVPFQLGEDTTWLDALCAAGFDPTQSSTFVSTGLSMYLPHEAVRSMLQAIAGLPVGTSLVLSFLLPIDQAEPALRPGIEAAARGAAANGTPWRSFFLPHALLDQARAAGFSAVAHVSAEDLNARYFAGRTDGLRLPLRSEELLVATVKAPAP